MEIIDNWILSFFFYGFLYLYLVVCMNDKHWSRRPGYEALCIYICDLITHVSEIRSNLVPSAGTQAKIVIKLIFF